MARRVIPLVGLSLGAVRANDSPVEKVITLLTDLKAEVQQDGRDEATAYDKFACFCKDTTKTKADKITEGRDKIEGFATSIDEDAAKKATDKTDLGKRKKKQEELASELDETTVRCQKEEAEFMAVIADLSKAIDSLDKAIKALTDAKPSSFLQRDDALKQVRETLAVAEVLGLVKEHSKVSVPAVLAQLQKVDPNDPSYKFHSTGILETLNTMKTDFTSKKDDENSEMTKAKSACTDMTTSLTGEMSTNSDAMGQLETSIADAEKNIAKNREDLVLAQDALDDDQSYMKDLTERCEARARDWDQRSASRADEIKALEEALAILKVGKDGGKSVQDMDAVNQRALVQKKALVSASAKKLVPSFLQQLTSERTVKAHTSDRDQLVDFIRQEGIKLKSHMLTELSATLNKDPFSEVKQLIQKLIQRLLDEATQEATKKGFCDMEVGKAKKERDFRFEAIGKLSAELTSLDARKDELNESIVEITDELPQLYDDLKNATEQRETDKKENLESIKTAKEGVAAVKEAITLLKAYYSSASRARVLLQASPVDEDTEGAGFEGAYKGKQDSAKGVIGLLEVIQSDFDRTARQTAQAEKDAQAEYVKFEQTSKEDIQAKETTLELNTQEMESVKNKLKKKIGDLGTAQKLLDDALKAIENLKPMCIDTGMTAAERIQKREEEIAALKQALTILQPSS